MKIAFTLFFLFLFILADMSLARHYSEISVNSKQLLFIEASIDSKIIYMIVTAGFLGVIKLKKNPS